MAETMNDLVESVDALEAAPSFPAAYVARVRAAVRRLDPFPPVPLDVPQAIELVTQESRIDIDVPLRTRRRGAKVAKLVVKRMTAFSMRYMADQVGDLGQALVHLGTALAARVDEVESGVAEARGEGEARLAALARRVTALEQAGTRNGSGDRGSPS
jgi:hypothetical protein